MKSTLKTKLDKESKRRNNPKELSLYASPDPLQVVHKNPDEYSALICALLSYGNAKAIVRYLENLDFSLLDAKSENLILKTSFKPYRFQKANEIQSLFIALYRLKKQTSLNSIFLKGFDKNHSIVEGIACLQSAIYESFTCKGRGYEFLIGKVANPPKAPLKRWMMYLRWMVRKDFLDLGIWRGVEPKELLVPLDTHTHRVALALGLLKRKTYDFRAVVELTNALRCFDENDPIKYDFALFRLGQESLIEQIIG